MPFRPIAAVIEKLDCAWRVVRRIEAYVPFVPEVGETLVIIGRDKEWREGTTTSPITRVLRDTDGAIYIATRNSVYRIRVVGGTHAARPAPVSAHRRERARRTTHS